MNTETRRAEYETRHEVLELLSDDEIARVSTREAGSALDPGDEYLDLKHLKSGVRRMTAETHVKLGDVLPRSAVNDETWSAICARLAERASRTSS
jgi:hypothetical protein